MPNLRKLFLCGLALIPSGAALPAEPVDPTVTVTPPAKSEPEARARAKILFETIQGTLQIMHRDFFDEEDGFLIPSRSLEDVFKEVGKSHQIEMHWLTVNADSLNVDHDARNEFEKSAVKEIAKGKPWFETVENNKLKFAGSIRLSSQCLKCHVKRRTTTEDRFSGLVIEVPIEK